MQTSFAEFFDDINDALKDAVRALGGFKKVGVLLWPELEQAPEQAANKIRDCLNPDRREKLSPQQLMFVMRKAREAGHHSLMGYVCAEAGYTAPTPIDPEALLADSQAEFVESVKRLDQLAKNIEKQMAARLAKPLARAA